AVANGIPCLPVAPPRPTRHLLRDLFQSFEDEHPADFLRPCLPGSVPEANAAVGNSVPSGKPDNSTTSGALGRCRCSSESPTVPDELMHKGYSGAETSSRIATSGSGCARLPPMVSNMPFVERGSA